MSQFTLENVHRKCFDYLFFYFSLVSFFVAVFFPLVVPHHFFLCYIGRVNIGKVIETGVSMGNMLIAFETRSEQIRCDVKT